MKPDDFFAMLRSLIAGGDTEAALRALRIFLEKTPRLNDVLQQSGRLERLRQESRLGLLSRAEASVEENRIRYGVLALLSEIEGEGAPPQALGDLLAAVESESGRPEVQAEVAQAISIVHSKNVLVNSTITAGGNVHIGDVYHGAPPLAPIRPLNELLTQTLIPAIQTHSVAAGRFLERAQNLPDWPAHPQAGDKAREILAYSYVGVVGIQLSKLFAIGKEAFSDNTLHKYVEKCLQLARHSLDLVTFALISQLWEEQGRQRRSFDASQTQAVADFFDRAFEPTLSEQMGLLETLHGLFLGHGLAFPIPELAGFGPNFQPGGALREAVGALGAIEAQWGKQPNTAETALAAERGLAGLLAALHFLAGYRMASVKRIGYWHIRTEPPRYLHRFAALGIDSKANVDAEKIDFTDATAYTDAVLLYRGDRYQTGINLSPFVVDHNALLLEGGVKACFYRARAIDGDELEYVFLEDNSRVRVAWKGLVRPDSNLNELLFDLENQRAYNLDNVVAQFREARRAILGEALNFDDL